MLKKILKSIILIFISSIIGLLLLCCAFSISTDSINDNIKKSAYILKEEKWNGEIYNWAESRMDSWTDSLMLLNAGDETEDSVLNKALEIYSCDPLSETLQPSNTETYKRFLSHYINDNACKTNQTYSRYWHGYLIFLKPLLTFLTYRDIRTINFVCQLFLTILICYFLYKKNLKKYITPYVLGCLMLNPLVIGNSLQYSSCFYVFNIGSLIILFSDENFLKKNDYLFFALIGTLLAYFDLLTYVPVAFAVPFLFYLIKNNNLSNKELLKKFVYLGFFFCVGYFGMWFIKWIYVDVFTNENCISNAINQSLFRTGIDKTGGYVYFNVSRWDAFVYTCKKNFVFFSTPFTLFAVCYFIWSIINLFANKKRINHTLIYLLVFCVPFVWFAIVLEHSIEHWYLFGNKNYVILVLTVLFMLNDYKEK